jgi:putative Mn2+ efflux pump MntP
MGLHAIREAGDIVEEAERFDLTGWRSTVLAGFAISTDELVFGFPLGATGLSILPVLCVIAVQAFIVVFVGVALGHWMSSRVSQLAGTAAGIAFIGLGAYLVLEHIFIVP